MSSKLLTSLFQKSQRPKIQHLIDVANEFTSPNEIIYNAMGIIKDSPDPDTIDKCIADIQNKQSDWNLFVFKPYQDAQTLEDKILESPPEIRDGDTPCRKCKQRKIIIVSQQTRSADEGFTTKMFCFNPECKYVETLG